MAQPNKVQVEERKRIEPFAPPLSITIAALIRQLYSVRSDGENQQKSKASIWLGNMWDQIENSEDEDIWTQTPISFSFENQNGLKRLLGLGLRRRTRKWDSTRESETTGLEFSVMHDQALGSYIFSNRPERSQVGIQTVCKIVAREAGGKNRGGRPKEAVVVNEQRGAY
ncbi:hypothetical protein B0H19DRAFT_1058120 [Mycena capillaripes]|nr:hypothetical protein B0H19DRAFT_1058120 [Mycena capillaripes]